MADSPAAPILSKTPDTAAPTIDAPPRLAPRAESESESDDAHPAPAPSAPPPIPGYRVLRILASGGMGSVFEAEQASPRRKVAIKVIRAGAAHPQLIQRFALEAQALGMLQHPGIARIYEAGTFDDGDGPQPFFVMEFVEGLPLGRYAAANKLAARDRLELLAKVCDGVHHAHQKGIIHRDLKPDNIVVDAAGQPKLLDFGVARVTESDMPSTGMKTQLGQVLGTVPYMSPEQLTGVPENLDIRSDVYSLGVIGYELLAGRMPHDFAGISIAEAARMIQRDDPKPLSSISRALGGDLATVIQKALEKDKERRYQSASDLAADIRRYLNDEPILARPPSAIYQWRKFARRNKALVGALAGVFAVLVGGIVATAWQARIASRGRNDARQAQARAEDALLAAERAKREAEQARVKADAEAKRADGERQAAEAVTQFLASLFDVGSPGLDPAAAALTRKLLDYGSARIDAELAREPNIQARMLSRLGVAYTALGDIDRAETMIRRALETHDRVFGAGSLEASHSAVALGEFLLWHRHDVDEAKELLRRALKNQEANGLPEIQRIPAMSSLANALTLGAGRTAPGIEEAMALTRLMIEIQEREWGKDSPKLTATRLWLANLLMRTGRDMAEGERLYREGLAALIREDPGNPYIGNISFELGGFLSLQNRYHEGLEYLQRSLDIHVKYLGRNHPVTRQTLGALVLCMGAAGRGDEVKSFRAEFEAAAAKEKAAAESAVSPAAAP